MHDVDSVMNVLYINFVCTEMHLCCCHFKIHLTSKQKLRLFNKSLYKKIKQCMSQLEVTKHLVNLC